MKKSFLKGLVSEIKENGVIAVAVATDASIDRDGEIVDAKGLDTKNFERNPVLLYAHDYKSDPIGKVLDIQKDGDRVLFQPQLAVDISPRAKMYFEMIKAGILNAFSIGFIPKRWEDRRNDDGSFTRIFVESELLEISLVPVPANANALVLAREYASKSVSDDEKSIAESIVKDLEENAETTPDTPAPSPAPEEKTVEQKIEEAIAPIRTMAEDIQKSLKEIADNRESKTQEAASVEELFRHPGFARAVLTAVDKSVGQALGRMKRN